MVSHSRFASPLALLLSVVVISACASTGPTVGPPSAGSRTSAGVAGDPPPVSSGPPRATPAAGVGVGNVNEGPPSPGITIAQRAQSALEGFVMGAIIGAQAGPIGMAIGAGSMLIYAAATGQSPLSSPRRSNRPGPDNIDYVNAYEAEREAELESQLEQQVARSDQIEDEIEAELRRQENLLASIDNDDADQPPAAPAPLEPETQPIDASLADLRVAPRVPKDRRLPLAIFQKEHATIPEGSWDNDDELEVVKRSLDADQDGTPEQVRYYDRKSSELLRKEMDLNYDGTADTWIRYEDERVIQRKLDADFDGTLDTWETYEEDRMASRVVDRNNDGVKDAFYVYEGESLVEERHDADNDGTIDLDIRYENRFRVSAKEDADHDGRTDSWTTYRVVDGEETVVRVERDSKRRGKADVIETFSAKDGKPVLTRREEDVNGDGNIDVTSIYENGKLVKREISDPSLVPL
jgi:hypothetical protein